MDWGEVRGDFTDTIVDNAFAGGYMAIRYLLDRGHRDIGSIPGQLAHNTGGGRHRGYLHALKEADILPNQAWIVQGDFESTSGYRAMQHILTQSTVPARYFAAATRWRWAHCAPSTIHDHGLRVPARHFTDRLR